VRRDPQLQRFYRRKLVRKGLGIRRDFVPARKLGIRLRIMLRDQIKYPEFCRGQMQRNRGDAVMPVRECLERTMVERIEWLTGE